MIDKKEWKQIVQELDRMEELNQEMLNKTDEQLIYNALLKLIRFAHEVIFQDKEDVEYWKKYLQDCMNMGIKRVIVLDKQTEKYILLELARENNYNSLKNYEINHLFI
ncbi:MAG: hypothetical protein PHY44_01660 [Lachnospiraceae bacterium]|nr:hypothetical protein [Lachnospiraceae bacterium]